MSRRKQMNFSEYQKECIKYSKYPTLYLRVGEAFVPCSYIYPTLGLGDESGEVLGKLKKLLRDRNGILTPEYLDAIKKEIGDVMWYVAMLCTELSLDLKDVCITNINKLDGRLERGTIKGSGDNR
jgi:NTP pyrophosphatase (non-canonical NTP hydrolase)